MTAAAPGGMSQRNTLVFKERKCFKDFFSSCDKLNALKEATAVATGLRGGTLFSLQALDFCEGALCSCANPGLYFIILRTKGCSN